MGKPRRGGCVDHRAATPRQALAAAVLAVLAVLLAVSPAQAAPAATPWYPTVDVTRDVVFGSATAADGSPTALTLDVYRSRELAGVRRPAVVWVHGGGFFMGDKADPADAQAARFLASRGFVVVSVNYRLRSGFTPFGPAMAPAAEDARADVQQAVRWLRMNHRGLDVDPFRIGVAGVSAGGLTALHVGYPATPDWLSSVQSVASLSGAGLVPMRVVPWSPPALMVNGTKDVLIPIAAARETCDRLNAARHRCQAVEVPANHDLAGYELLVGTSTVDHLATTLQLDQDIAIGRWLRAWASRSFR
ncbi:MAG: alpha/beta hydrolase [Acidimicrobiales bacterium]